MQEKIVAVTTQKLTAVSDGEYSVASGWDQLDAVRMCRALLKVYVSAENQVRSQWASLWMTCSKVVRAYHENKDWEKGYINAAWEVDSPLASPEELFKEDRALACECLDIIQSHPEHIVRPASASGKAGGQVPGELVAALWLFISEEETPRFEELKTILPEHTTIPPLVTESEEPTKMENEEEEKVQSSESESSDKQPVDTTE